MVKTNTTNPSKQTNDLAESIRETGNVDQILEYFIILDSKHLSLKSEHNKRMFIMF